MVRRTFFGSTAFGSTAARLRGGAGLLLVLLLAACASDSRYVGMDADTLYDAAMASYEEGDWDEAATAFELFATTFPGDSRIPDVGFHLGRAYFESGQYLTAANEFEVLLTRFPSHGRAPEASLGICRSYVELSPHPERDQEYTHRAREACRRTRDEFAGTNVAAEAEELRQAMVDRLAESLYLEARFYQRRGAHDSAIIVFQELVDFYPETAWAPQGFLGLYTSYREIGWEEEASQARSRLLFLYPESDAAAQLRADDDGANGSSGRARR